jgi:hypothetical protein
LSDISIANLQQASTESCKLAMFRITPLSVRILTEEVEEQIVHHIL